MNYAMAISTKPFQIFYSIISSITVFMMKNGEDNIVAKRVHEELAKAAISGIRYQVSGIRYEL